MLTYIICLIFHILLAIASAIAAGFAFCVGDDALTMAILASAVAVGSVALVVIDTIEVKDKLRHKAHIEEAVHDSDL